jgi:hypothetical protein
MAYDLGDTVPIGVAIRNAADALVNPSTIVLTVTLPDGTTATPTPTNDSTGLYSSLYVPTQAGRHLVRWVTTVPNTAHTDAFDVSPAAAPLIIGLSEAKAYLNIRSTDTTQDDELRSMLEGVTATVEKIVGPVVRRQVTSTLYPTCYSSAMSLPYTNILTVDSAALVSDASVVSVTGWHTDGGMLWLNYGSTFPYYPFTVTYTVGLPDLPANIRMGALEILKNAWTSQRSSDPVPFLVPNRAMEWLAPSEKLLGFA